MTTNAASEDEAPPYRDIDDVIGELQMNRYHYILLILCGLGFCVDAMEVVALSFINPCAGAEFKLVNSQIAGITSAVFAGEFLGSMFWGPFADVYGRWKAYMYSFCLLCCASWISGFASSYGWLLFLRFLVGIGVGGSFVPFDIYAEFLPADVRGKQLTLTNMFWTAGELYVIVMAYWLLPNYGWRGLIFAIAVPVTVGGISSYFILPESPRWLITQGRYMEAEAIVQEAAKHSDKKPLPFTFKKPIIMNNGDKSSKLKAAAANNINSHIHSKNVSILAAFWDTIAAYKEILFDPIMGATTLRIGTVWACFGFAYYGVVLLITKIYEESSSSTNAVANTNVNAVCSFNYDSIAVNTSSEVLGIIAAMGTVDWLGRRLTQMWTYGLGAIALVMMGLLHQESASTILILGYIMRSSAMAASITTWTVTPELYPTRVRATAHSVVNCFARIGALCSPYLVISSLTNLQIAFILGLVNVVAVIASWSLHETVGIAMDKKVATATACNEGGANVSNPVSLLATAAEPSGVQMATL